MLKDYRAFAGRNKLGKRSKPCLEEDHSGTPQSHGYFGHGSPLILPTVFIGASENSDYSSQNVRERGEKEAYGQSIRETDRHRCYGDDRRYDIRYRAIGNSIFPKGLTERYVTPPECC